MRAGVVAAFGLLAGCDLAFGLTGDPRACELVAFDGVTGETVIQGSDVVPDPNANIDAFSIAWGESLAIVQASGQPHQVALPAVTPSSIDLGVYVSASFAMAADGDGLFYSAAIEPPLLQAAHLAGDTWSTGSAVPAGIFAGTPSSREFGPRRVLVRLRDGRPEVQEYEERGTHWVAIGDAHALDGTFGPNLTPAGLEMTFAAGGIVFAATRAKRTDWFSDPTPIMQGGHLAPQLFDHCRRLYSLDQDHIVRRYDR